MAKIFISGSSDGLGELASRLLIQQGHQVVVHARNQQRAETLAKKIPQADKILIADLSSISETIALAQEINQCGHFDAVIHNAAIYQATEQKMSPDGLPLVFAVNSLAPYVLTCLMHKPKRLIYMSSGMHFQGNADLKSCLSPDTKFIKTPSYSDTKLHNLLLSKAVSRRWKPVFSNAVNPGWVPTKMGGSSAPDDLLKGAETQVWLAVSEENAAKVSGRYFHHQKEVSYLKEADDSSLQDEFLKRAEILSGVVFPL